MRRDRACSELQTAEPRIDAREIEGEVPSGKK